MNNQTTQEWDEMSQQQQTEIRDRLIAACETRANVNANIARGRLERAGRSGLAARLLGR